jgi:Flp pilus assembly protein protease CpaA
MIVSLVTLLLIVFALVWDLRRRTIPDWIPFLLLAWGILAAAFQWHGVSWWSSVVGALIALALALPLFALGGFGGGDVKLLVGLGAVLGHKDIWMFVLWMGVAGGVVSVVARWRGQREIAYVPAMALGFIGFLIWKGEFNRVLSLS